MTFMIYFNIEVLQKTKTVTSRFNLVNNNWLWRLALAINTNLLHAEYSIIRFEDSTFEKKKKKKFFAIIFLTTIQIIFVIPSNTLLNQ